MDAMNTAVNAVLPYMIYLVFGWILRTAGIMDEPFLKKLNQAIFLSLFPITMFSNTHNLSLDFASCSRVLLTGLACLASVIALSVLLTGFFVKENSRRAVIVQALYRSNALLFALGLAESIFGSEGSALASIAVAVFVPIYNVVAIIVLESFRGGKTDVRSLTGKVLKNPLFLGAAAGLAWSLTGIALPSVIESTMSKLSGMSTPLALMILGGTMHLSSVKKNFKAISTVVILKMILIPAAVTAICSMLGLTSVELFVVFVLFATPVAVSSYPMAQNMGGDGELAGELVVMTTLASVITLFGWIMILRSAALI